MLALVVVDQGNSEQSTLKTLVSAPAAGEVITIDGRTCIVEQVDSAESPHDFHEILVRCRLVLTSRDQSDV